MNIVAPILHFGVTRRHAPALVEGERTIDFGALADCVTRTGGHLVALGVRQHERRSSFGSRPAEQIGELDDGVA